MSRVWWFQKKIEPKTEPEPPFFIFTDWNRAGTAVPVPVPSNFRNPCILVKEIKKMMTMIVFKVICIFKDVLNNMLFQ